MQSSGRAPVVGAEALSLLEGVTELCVAKGKRILRFDLERERPSDEEILELILGRSGKLRAPALRTGTRLVVGYNEELLETTLGQVASA